MFVLNSSNQTRIALVQNLASTATIRTKLTPIREDRTDVRIRKINRTHINQNDNKQTVFQFNSNSNKNDNQTGFFINHEPINDQ